MRSALFTLRFLCLFCTSLPSETAARVLDALFNEGPKILFRVALAILSTLEQQLLGCENNGGWVSGWIPWSVSPLRCGLEGPLGDSSKQVVYLFDE